MGAGAEIEDGERLDRHAARRFPALSRAEIAEAIRGGLVTVNGRRAAKGLKLKAGDRVELDALAARAAAAAAPLEGDASLPLEVLYEDAAVAAVCKPAGMPTQPLRADEKGTLVHALLARWPEMAEVGTERLCPAVLHRLDVWTSGVVLAAKRRDAWEALRAQFRARTVEKHYWAVVEGRAGPGASRLPLTHQSRSPCRMRVVGMDARGRPDAAEIFDAATEWTPLRATDARTWLDVLIRSGVTHQIRCHLAAAGHPIAGDVLYGASPVPAGHHFLHARSIRWADPDTGKPVLAEAPAPGDFLELANG